MRLFARSLAPLALAGALFLGACQNPDGTVDVPSSLALGAGLALAGLAIASANDRSDHYDNRRYHRAYRGDHRRHGYRRW